MQADSIAHTGNWIVRNKEVIAAIGGMLGVAPRAFDFASQLTQQQKQTRRLTEERQNLELFKLRYEVEKIRRELGQPAAPLIEPAAPAAPAVVPPEPVVESVAEQRVRRSRPPGAVRWLLAHPRFGQPLLFIWQMIFAVLLGFSALVTVVFPFAMIADSESRGELGWTIVWVEVVYALMSWGFYAMYRKMQRWRKPAA